MPSIGDSLLAKGWKTGCALSEPLCAAASVHIGTKALMDDSLPYLSDPLSRIFVLSQECDLVAFSLEQEPFAECIVGVPSPTIAKDSSTLRSLRKHTVVADDRKAFGLEIKRRLWLPRELLCEFEPYHGAGLSRAETKRLKKWASRRYGRAAFPNALNVRLGFQKSGSPGRAILLKLRDYALQIRVSVAPPEDELPPDEVYKLDVFVVLDPRVPTDKKQAECMAELDIFLRAVSGVKARCSFGTPAEITYAQLQSNEEWHLDDLSLSSVPDENEKQDGFGRD